MNRQNFTTPREPKSSIFFLWFSFASRRFLCIFLSVLGVLGVLSAEVASPKPSLEVGQAALDITPKVGPKEKPVWMAGFGKGRKATGVADPLFARAAVLSDGKRKLALVSVDLVGLFLASAQRVQASLPGFDRVIVSSTHNHEGPDTMGLWGATPLESGIDRDYLAWVEKRIVEAVQQADRGRQPVRAALGTVAAPELLHDGRQPIVLHDDLVVLQFIGHNDKTTGIIVQWNCHPETLDSRNTLLSADYVGYTVNHLEKKFGCPVLYLTGTVGGLMTSLHVEIKNEKGVKLKDGTFEKTARYGELLGRAAEKALGAAKSVKLTPFVLRRRELFLPLDNKLYVVAKQIGVLERETLLWKNADAAEKVDEFDPRKRHAVRTEVNYLQLGELSIACIPGEIYPELVLDRVAKAEPGVDYPDAPAEPSIYKAMPGPHRMLIGLANDEIGYILPKRQWDEKPPFAYGLKRAPYGEINSLGAETAGLLCEAFAKLTRER